MSEPSNKYLFTEELLKLAHEYEFADLLFWDSEVNFSLVCSDVFMWGLADLEHILIDDLPELRKAFSDTDVKTGVYLFCARKRKMRPQGAFYKYIPEKFWPLFNACGPEREISIGNPHIPGHG